MRAALVFRYFYDLGVTETAQALGPNGATNDEPVRSGGDYGASVVVKQAKGPWVAVPIWEGPGVTDQQMMQLAAEVHAHNAVHAFGS
jgi:hypothetical protein